MVRYLDQQWLLTLVEVAFILFDLGPFIIGQYYTALLEACLCLEGLHQLVATMEVDNIREVVVDLVVAEEACTKEVVESSHHLLQEAFHHQVAYLEAFHLQEAYYHLVAFLLLVASGDCTMASTSFKEVHHLHPLDQAALSYLYTYWVQFSYHTTVHKGCFSP